MRNLLYTLLVGLVIVSCQKEEYGADYSSISPIENVTVDLTERFNAFNDLISGIELSKENVASTSKGGDNGTNWIELAWFESGNEGYVYLRPEDLGNGCYDGIHSDISNARVETYTLGTNPDSSNAGINIQIGDDTGQWFDLPASLTSRYNAAFGATTSSIYFADFDTTWSVRFGALPTVTTND